MNTAGGAVGVGQRWRRRRVAGRRTSASANGVEARCDQVPSWPADHVGSTRRSRRRAGRRSARRCAVTWPARAHATSVAPSARHARRHAGPRRDHRPASSLRRPTPTGRRRGTHAPAPARRAADDVDASRVAADQGEPERPGPGPRLVRDGRLGRTGRARQRQPGASDDGQRAATTARSVRRTDDATWAEQEQPRMPTATSTSVMPVTGDLNATTPSKTPRRTPATNAPSEAGEPAEERGRERPQAEQRHEEHVHGDERGDEDGRDRGRARRRAPTCPSPWRWC